MMETSTTDGAARLGQLVSGRYRIEQLLGEGGMGAVYLAEHTLMRKRVALKLLHADMSGNEEVLARFQREAQAAARIEHPNIVAATDFGRTEDGGFFLVLEYVEGTSLRAALAAGALGHARALHVARQIAVALERAHGAGIVHRDLKPENVMLVEKNDDPDFVKVLDFGIAKLEAAPHRDGTNEPLTRLGTILGTPEYMAPEQALGEAVGPAADLYAVGVILYEMLTGKHPFDTTDSMAVLSMHMIAPIPPMSERAPEASVPPNVEAVVRTLLEKEVKNRYDSARALVEAIDAAAAGSGLDVGRPTSSTFTPKQPVPIAPPSTRDAGWNAKDAFAKTSIGTPAAPVPPPSSAHAVTSAALDSLDRAKQIVERLPRGAVIGASIGVPLLVLIGLVALVLGARSGEATTEEEHGDASVTASEAASPAETKSKLAPEAKIHEAEAIGPPALEALAREYPDDPRIVRSLALQYDRQGRIADSLAAIRSMLALGRPGIAAADSPIVQIVVGAAGVSETEDDAFALMEGPLGASGVDALIELAQVKSSRKLQLRANRSLAKADVRANASPAAGVLLDMKSARRCGDKHDLLERAAAEGDARLLPALEKMKEQRGCGFMRLRDCYPCLRKDSALEDAIKGIEARSSR